LHLWNPMSLYQTPNEPVRLEFTNEESWSVAIHDEDLDGAAISHSGDDLRMEIRDENDTVIVTATTANGLITVTANSAGVQNIINIAIGYSTTKDLPAGSYYGTVVRVISADERERIVSLEFSQSNGYTRTV